MTERSRDRDAAIVGMACIFPGAPDLATYAKNLESGFDAISEVPQARWDPVFYDPASSAADRFYCKRGGFVDEFASFDALAFGVMPVAARGAEPDQLLALQVAQAALVDAGFGVGAGGRALPRERTGVVIGRGNYIGAGMTRLEQHVRTAEQLAQCLRALVPSLRDDEVAKVKAEFQSKLGGYGPDTAIGLVPNLTASRIANRLDLMGPAYTLDAACASSLVALDEACRSLFEGRTDLMICGGVHLSHDVAFWSVFCQLGALSRAQQIRPFDERADGILIGEGVGLVVLRRLADAERDGDRIYAVVRGCGVASDGREASLLTPRVEGQVLALSRAYAAARVAPETVALIEGHGTGTPAGDAAELTTLARFFGAHREGDRRSVLGSVKSMIGHAMPAAGVAGLIKAALAVERGVLFPTLHCETPHPLLRETRFRTLSASEPWEEGGASRRAGVSAFGFGGINAHAVLEAHEETQAALFAPGPRTLAAGKNAEASAHEAEHEERFLLLAAPTPEALLAAVERGAEDVGHGPARLALALPTPERRKLAAEAIRRGVSRHGREGIAFSARGLAQDGGKVAFLFPGVEAAFKPRATDVARYFGRAEPPCAEPNDLEEQGLGILSLGRLFHDVLLELRVRPDALAGHSIGEWTGLIAAGMLDNDAADDFIATLAPGSLEVPGVVFAAVGCGAAQASRACEGLRDISLSHDNCPHQGILCGQGASVDIALGRLKKEGVLCQKLPFRSGFHSPLFEEFLAPHRENLSRLPLGRPAVPLWSATTCEPYPSDLADVHRLILDHLVRPVRFRELLLALYESGVRMFVQLGVGSLAGFVDDTLRGHPHFAMAASLPHREGMTQLRRLAASLWVEGVAVDLARLGMAPKAPQRRSMTLHLGVPLVQLDTPLSLPAASANAAAMPSGTAAAGTNSSEVGVLAELRASMEALLGAQSEVAKAWSSGRAAAKAVTPAALAEASTQVTFSASSHPHLLDHCFFRQPASWESVADRYPVVPLTMTLSRIVEAARALAKGQVAIAIENVRAFKWLAVEPPATVTFRARSLGDGRVKVEALGFTEATVVFADAYPSPPAPSGERLSEPRPAAIDATTLYCDHWMFHGPSYQGVSVLGPCAKDGIRGELVSGGAEGALLDNAGQLFGYWIMEFTDRDRLAMPVKIDRVLFFGPHPAAGERVLCSVHVRELGAREVRADLELVHAGRVFARIIGWTDWRFETDARLWPIVREPESHLYAQVREGGAYVMLAGVGRSPASRDYLSRRFLREAERVDYDKVGARAQRAWLLGRIAAKDAARDFHWRREAPARSAIFPTEVAVRNGAFGAPELFGPRASGLHVSLAHKDDVAVARVAQSPTGIDVEPIAPRSDSFVETAFTAAERALVGDRPRDEWWTRLWCAKEAVAKAAGTGLEGAPRRFVIDSIDGDRVRCGDRILETRVEEGFVVAWVAGDPE